MAERPQHHGIDVLAHGAGEVGDALARAQAGLVARQEDAGAAELGDGRLEADARPQRRLLEDQPEHAAQQHRLALAALLARLQFGRLVQEVYDFVPAHVEEIKEVTHGA